MTTLEYYQQQLEKAEKKLDEASAALKSFQELKYGGIKLEELRDKEDLMVKEKATLERLTKKEADLENAVKECREVWIKRDNDLRQARTESQTANKRPYEKIDASAQVLDRLRKRAKPSLPDSDELATFLEQSLTNDIKVPLLRDEFDTFLVSGYQDPCTAEDLEILFRVSDTESAYTFVTGVLGSAIMTPSPPLDGTKYSFVTFWDTNIRRFLETFFSSGHSVRNTNQRMISNNMRPDFGFILNRVSPFRGEEKAPHSREEAWTELVDKIQWTYDPAPYVLGYYAIGPSLTYVALCRPRLGSYKPDIIPIGTVDLSLRKERIRNLRILINLCTIIELVQDVIVWRETTEFVPIERCVEEFTYHGPDGEQCTQKLRNIYNMLKNEHVPNVDNLILSYTDNDHGCVAYLAPKGMSVRPNTQKELLEAIICVLEALSVMHEAETPIFHRDIRWQNIIQLHGSQWMLIDWDDASSMSTRAASHLERANHAPEVFNDYHKGEVDIWSAGKLIRDAAVWILDLSADVVERGRWMRETKPRPTAADALKAIQDVYRTMCDQLRATAKHKEYPYMKNSNYNGSTEYEKAMRFLEIGCNCGCSRKITREKFAELREAFQALSRSEQDIFLMAQLKAMNGGEITASRRFKKKTRCNMPLCQKTYLNMLGIGRTHFENVRNHLATNGVIPRVHGNVKKVPRWKTKIIIDITVATAVKNFFENYAEINGLPSPGRNVNRITQSLTLLPAETSYKSIYRDFIAGLEIDSTLKLLKYDAFRKL
ncbi:hypothetical protein G9A89_008622 [Geosiphon pyriformis]|nr:hypothetical protein G9A89_008622 [Geosiphon pyriformis]